MVRLDFVSLGEGARQKSPVFHIDLVCMCFQVGGDELTELLKLHDSVYDQATGWFTSLKDDMKNQITSHFGQLPGKDLDPQVNVSKLDVSH